MPKGEPAKQTIATEKYQKKAGYMTKGFKLKRDLVEQFEAACTTNEESQASVISRFMKKYVENTIK